MTQKKKDAKIDLEFESLDNTFIAKHPKLKIKKTKDIYISRYDSPIDNVINELTSTRDELLINGASNIKFELDYRREYYDEITIDTQISYEVEEGELEYKKRLIALHKQSLRTKEQIAKKKIIQEENEKEIYERLKKKFEKK